MRTALPALMFAMLAAGCASAPPVAPATDAWTTGVKFGPMGSAVKAEAATLAGSQSAAGLYTIRVHVAKGGSIAPHTHPDMRILTVVSGEIFYGFGDKADIGAAKLYRTGDVFTVPASAPHFAFASTSDAVYQEAGMGPTAFVPVK